MKPYPIKLIPVTKSPIWGGTRLKTDWRVKTDAKTVGESWVLTVRKDEKNVIANGAWANKTLDEVINEYGCADKDNFPLLVKLIDAGDRLSVQVHPDDEYAKRVENDRGKTEMWYILEADEGSEIICGLKPGHDRKSFEKAVKDGKTEDELVKIKVKPGETYFIPAGMPHAIGKGILIAEIQQNCDLTYRIYDYGRLGKDGKPRELHIDKALDVIRHFTADEIENIRYENAKDREIDKKIVLADCKRFRVERREVNGEENLAAYKSFRHLLCIGGEGEIVCNGESYPVARADSYLLPPDREIKLLGNLTCIISCV